MFSTFRPGVNLNSSQRHFASDVLSDGTGVSAQKQSVNRLNKFSNKNKNTEFKDQAPSSENTKKSKTKKTIQGFEPFPSTQNSSRYSINGNQVKNPPSPGLLKTFIKAICSGSSRFFTCCFGWIANLFNQEKSDKKESSFGNRSEPP